MQPTGDVLAPAGCVRRVDRAAVRGAGDRRQGRPVPVCCRRKVGDRGRDRGLREGYRRRDDGRRPGRPPHRTGRDGSHRRGRGRDEPRGDSGGDRRVNPPPPDLGRGAASRATRVKRACSGTRSRKLRAQLPGPGCVAPCARALRGPRRAHPQSRLVGRQKQDRLELPHAPGGRGADAIARSASACASSIRPSWTSASARSARSSVSIASGGFAA